MPFSGPASSSDSLSDIETGGVGPVVMLLQKQRPNVAARITLQEPDLDAISLALKLVVIDLIKLLQTGWLTRWVWSN